MIRKLSVSFGLGLGVLISAICELNVSGKHYVSLAFASAFFLYWAAEFIASYVFFRLGYKEKYRFYKVQLINSSNLTMEIINNNNKKYYKQFKRTMLKDSAIKILYIFILLGLCVATLVALFV